MEKIMLPVSIGEALDKLTILEIKYKYIHDEQKRRYVETELNEIYPLLGTYKSKVQFHYECLYRINKRIWHLSDNIRLPNLPDYNDKCIALINENDNRFRIKNKINNILDSNIKEQKSYNAKKAVLLVHLDLNNCKFLNGIIRYYSIIFDEVVIFAIKEHYDTIKTHFADDRTIKITEHNNDFSEINEKYLTDNYEIFPLYKHKFNDATEICSILKISPDVITDFYHLNV